MKLIKAGLLNNVVSSYDQTKTTIQGRVSQKTFSGSDFLGPPLTKFNDFIADAPFTPSGAIVKTVNDRIFVPFSVAAGTMGLAMYNHNPLTNVNTYVGQIRFLVPNTAATTQTIRGLKIIDTGTTGWKIFLSTTGSILINGGTFLINKIDAVDFVASPSTIGFAIGSDQKSVYFLQDSTTLGVSHLNTATAGSILDFSNNKIYVHNGIAATHQYYVFDTLIAPTYSSSAITGTESTNTINHSGHSFVNNDPIAFSSLVGGTGLTNTTVYFVRNSVAGVSYEVSATTGGISINFTTDITSGNSGRAFGTTGSNFLFKTGNLPVLTGTLIILDSEDYAVPAHTANSGFACAFFATTTNLYLGKLSELTIGATTWTSLVSSNILGTTNQITTPTLSLAAWSTILDAAVYVTNSSKLIIKKVINNQIIQNFGRLNNIYYEGFTIPSSVPIGLVTISGIDVQNGVLVFCGTSAGQRGFVTADIYSDFSYEYSYLTTPVLNTPNSILEVLSSVESKQSFETGSIKVQYRTSGFGSISGSWTDLPTLSNLNLYASGNQIQFKIRFQMQSESFSNPTQIRELYLGITSLSEISDNWEYSDDNSDNNTPSRIAFRLKQTYVGAVPTLYFRAYDLSDALLINNNTVTNSTNFQYSTDDGVSWLPLGTIPNTVGTLIRYTFTSPPGVKIRPGLREV